MSVKSPAKGIYDILHALGTVDTGGWFLAIDDMSADPDEQVVVYNRGGRAGEVAVAIDYPSVQIIARGRPGGTGSDDAWQKLQACRLALIGIPSGPADYPELTSCVAQTDITTMGRDDKKRPLLSLNLNLIVSYDTSGYRVL